VKIILPVALPPSFPVPRKGLAVAGPDDLTFVSQNAGQKHLFYFNQWGVGAFFQWKTQKRSGIIIHDGLWPFFAMLQYNNGAIPRFLLVRNPVSLLYAGVFPSVLRYVLLQGNAQLRDTQVL
jgi:hypothetical protein